MTPEDWLTAIKVESAVLASTPTDVLERRVPTCPEWTVHDLLGHVGAVHRWAAGQVDGSRRHRGYGGIPVPEGAAVVDWYVQSRDELVHAFAGRDSNDLVHTFVGERPVAFWHRRQANELAVHRWDLESAARPGAQRPVDPALAADGIDEWLEVFASRFISLGPGVPDELVGRTLHLHATDKPDAEWLIEVTATGLNFCHEHAKGDVALRGLVSDLYLTLWHRRTHRDLDVEGEKSLAQPILDLVHVT